MISFVANYLFWIVVIGAVLLGIRRFYQRGGSIFGADAGRPYRFSALIGAFALLFTLIEAARQGWPFLWPTTEATILNSSVAGPCRCDHSISLDIQYEYVTDSRTWRGATPNVHFKGVDPRLYHALMSSDTGSKEPAAGNFLLSHPYGSVRAFPSQEEASAALTAFHPGSSRTVRYSPHDPALSYLHIRFDTQSILAGLLFGGFLLYYGLNGIFDLSSIIAKALSRGKGGSEPRG